MIGLAAFTQMAFVDNRNYPGGPSAFEFNMFSAPINQAGNVALVVSNMKLGMALQSYLSDLLSPSLDRYALPLSVVCGVL